MYLITVSMTLEPDTTLEQAQLARDCVVDVIRYQAEHQLNQKNAIIGSSLEEG